MFRFSYPQGLLEAAQYPELTLSFSPHVSPTVIILSFIWVIPILNLLPVKNFGQMEYCFGIIKMVFLIIMILMNIILHTLQRITNERNFWTYNKPWGPTATNITLADGRTVIGGGTGRLAGMW
jgi:amino acid transporter